MTPTAPPLRLSGQLRCTVDCEQQLTGWDPTEIVRFGPHRLPPPARRHGCGVRGHAVGRQRRMDILRARLNDRDTEVEALNAVILKQGRQIQQSSSAAVDEALRRKEGLLRAHQARCDKVEAENEALREELQRMRRDAARRDEEDRQRQTVTELVAAPAAAVATEAAVARAADAEEAEEAKRVLGVVREELRTCKLRKAELEDVVSELRERSTRAEAALAEAKRAAAHEEKASAAAASAPAATALRRGSIAFDGGAKREGGEGGVGSSEGLSLPSETYHALMSQREELTEQVRMLERRLASHERGQAAAARQREAAAHAAMAERCAQITRQLRVAETRVARTTAALDPALKRLKGASEENATLRRECDHLRVDLDREVRLRTAVARMALAGYHGMHSVQRSAQTLRQPGVGPQARWPAAPAGAHGGPGGLLPPPLSPPPHAADAADAAYAYAAPVDAAPAQAYVAAQAAEAEAILQTALTTLNSMGGLAPFSTPPLPHLTPPSLLQQLHLLADLPPPNDAHPAHAPATSLTNGAMAAADEPMLIDPLARPPMPVGEPAPSSGLVLDPAAPTSDGAAFGAGPASGAASAAAAAAARQPHLSGGGATGADGRPSPPRGVLSTGEARGGTDGCGRPMSSLMHARGGSVRDAHSPAAAPAASVAAPTRPLQPPPPPPPSPPPQSLAAAHGSAIGSPPEVLEMPPPTVSRAEAAPSLPSLGRAAVESPAVDAGAAASAKGAAAQGMAAVGSAAPFQLSPGCAGAFGWLARPSSTPSLGRGVQFRALLEAPHIPASQFLPAATTSGEMKRKPSGRLTAQPAPMGVVGAKPSMALPMPRSGRLGTDAALSVSRPTSRGQLLAAIEITEARASSRGALRGSRSSTFIAVAGGPPVGMRMPSRGGS